MFKRCGLRTSKVDHVVMFTALSDTEAIGIGVGIIHSLSQQAASKHKHHVVFHADKAVGVTIISIVV